VEIERWDGEVVDGAWVGREDVGEHVGEGLIGGCKLLLVVIVVSVVTVVGEEGLRLIVEVYDIRDKRGGNPDMAPPGGKDLGVSGFLGGEK
jgi:hypothetical protein